ncbi:MAG TPA: hypothetical protein VLW85_12220 [Myxococcales bacterium]|nr:hypothetical protein [Myxococcales bacterium]
MEAALKKLAYGWHGPLLIDQGFLSHLGWGFAVPLLGYFAGGSRWLRILSIAWMLHALYRELVEEALEASTVSDLVSRMAPAALLLAADLLRERQGLARRAATDSALPRA